MKKFFVLVAALSTLALFCLSPASQVQSEEVTPTGLQDYARWFGSLHAHTDMDGDDGTGTAAEAFAYARNIPHLDFYAITPHLHFPWSGNASLWYESTYDQIRADAAEATDGNFVAIAGMESSTISSGGHWNLFNADDLIDEGHTSGDWNDGDDYYDHVAGIAGAGQDVAAQFNHANTGDFGDLYVPEAAPYFGTFAVSSGYTNAYNQAFDNNGSNLEYGTNNPLENLWAHYLNLGWKLSPSADQDNHRATWGTSSSEYTVIVRPVSTTLSLANVMQGLRDHMTYATEDPNMQIGFTANGWSMGQTIGGPGYVRFEIWWYNPSETLYNDNHGIVTTETPNDVIQTIWIYKNQFRTLSDSVGSNAGNYVAIHHPSTVSGTWSTNLPARVGDWFVVKFQDSYTLANDVTYGRTTSKDLTWSAPVWYDPDNADTPITVWRMDPTPTPTPTPTPEPTPTPTPEPPTYWMFIPVIER